MSNEILLDWPWLLCAYGICFYFMNKALWLHGKSDFTDSLLNCSFCVGFHAGWITWACVNLGYYGSIQITLKFMLLSICYGFMSASFCYCVDTVTQLAESWVRSDGQEQEEPYEEDSWEEKMRREMESDENSP